MSLPFYATMFNLSPFGKPAIVQALRSKANDLRNTGNEDSMDSACAHLVAAGFFSMDLGDLQETQHVAEALDSILAWYEAHGASDAQKMRAHANGLLFGVAVRVFKHDRNDLQEHHDALQRDLSTVIVECNRFANRWRLAQVQASQLQLYLDWFVLGENHPQTLLTLRALLASDFGDDKLRTATGRWFQHAGPEWYAFVARAQALWAKESATASGSAM